MPGSKQSFVIVDDILDYELENFYGSFFISVGDNLVTLSPYPMDDPNSTYISAVSVDGAKIRKQYLASQLPMPSTRTDFWRLIVEKNIELVIILQRPDLNDDVSINYFI